MINEATFQRKLKKIIDSLAAPVALILISPLFLVVAFLIKLDSKGPVFFRQIRVGKNGKLFRVWKFRTMVEGAEKMGLGYEIAENDPRITRVGKILRRFGMDEFPQVINIIFGEMSLVGPRPALPHQVAKYTEFERRRLEVKPGLTNINMLKGWNTLSWKKRIAWDVWYIDNWSLWLDLKIFFKTPIIVLLGKGQYGEKGVVEDYE